MVVLPFATVVATLPKSTAATTTTTTRGLVE